MTLIPEISIGDILTIVSILVSVIALLISWQRNRELKRKDVADKIRHGAGMVVVKLQRWRELSIHYFEDIQPLITEVDMEFVKKGSIPEVMNTFWVKLSDLRTKTSQRIIDEQIETAYIDLFGFDPRIQILFNEVVNRLKLIDNSIYTQARYSTQADILTALSQPKKYKSSELGNKLRNTCYMLANECQQLMDGTIEPFSKEMIRLIELSDLQIVKRKFKTSTVTDLYALDLDQLREKMDMQVEEILTQTAKASAHSSVFVPLVRQNERIGVISLDSLHHEIFSKELEKEIVDIADEAKKTIDLAKSKKELKQDALKKFNKKSLSNGKRSNKRK